MTFVRLAVMAALYAAGACVVSWAVGMTALAGLPVVAALVLKALLVALVLVVVTWRGCDSSSLSGRHVVLVGLAAALGFALDPFTWAARTFVGQLVGAEGGAGLVLDLVAWLAVVVATAVAAVRRHAGTTVAYA